MAQAYVEEEMADEAVFSLFVRRLPENRNYLLACGQAGVLEAIERVRFTSEDLAYLDSLGEFSNRFLDWLADYRFGGDIRAVAEGAPIFADEPIMEVSAPIAEAQILETVIMTKITLQTVLASKAARVVEAAKGRAVVDFGARRMHGIEAAVDGARAYHIAGVSSTSNVLAGKIHGLPVSGTMAHSYIQAHEDEERAFRAFARAFPSTTLLVDTYDTLEGVKKAIAVAKEYEVGAVRLDSGDQVELSRRARDMLDAAGLSHVKIFSSSGLDEYEIAAMLEAGARIDGFGIGTAMGVSKDAPDLDLVYKLCAYAGRGRLKLSSGKPILPGRKQVFRVVEGETATHDILARAEENFAGEPLLAPVMESGRILPAGRTDLEAARAACAKRLEALPSRVRANAPADPPFAVRVSDALERYTEQVKDEVRRHG